MATSSYWRIVRKSDGLVIGYCVSLTQAKAFSLMLDQTGKQLEILAPTVRKLNSRS